MADHMICIGFDMSDEAEMKSLLKQMLDQGEQYAVDNGVYCRWQGNGEEVWLQFTLEGHFMGANPHFAGDSRIAVTLEGCMSNPMHSPLDGALLTRTVCGESPTKEVSIPIVADVPNVGLYGDLQFPASKTLQIAAFPHTLNCYESEAAFIAAQAGQDQKIHSRSFFPAGIVPDSGNLQEADPSFGTISGLILKRDVRQNALTGLSYNWGLLDTPVGTIDVVWGTEMLPTSVTVGNVLSGLFWLSAIIIEEKPDQRRIN